MDEWTNEWMNEWTNGWMDEGMKRQANQKNKLMNKGDTQQMDIQQKIFSITYQVDHQ